MNIFRNRWLIYIRERFPLLTFGALSGGIAFSGLALSEQNVRFIPFAFCFIGILLFFGLQRLMDDVKSRDQDKLAYPDRPLPLKIISKDEALHVVHIFHRGLFVYSLILWIMVNVFAALVYTLSVVYLWEQYLGFHLGRWLLQRPFLHGLLRHLSLFLLIFFTAAAGNPTGFLGPSTWVFAVMVTASFFCYDICAKFNPRLHPVLGTYLHFYGFRRSFEVAAMMLVVSAIASIYLALDPLLIPCELIVLFSMATLFWQPGWFKLPEMTASISLMTHVWAPAIFRVFHS